jgi:hypothetical protein
MDDRETIFNEGKEQLERMLQERTKKVRKEQEEKKRRQSRLETFYHESCISHDGSSYKGNGVLYTIVNEANGKRYIGATYSLYYRIRRHKHELLMNHHYNKELQADFNKYGFEPFRVDIIEERDGWTKARLREAEIKLIRSYPREQLYNERSLRPIK